MITGLDHVVLACPDLAAGSAAYGTLLGASPVWCAASDGAGTALFKVNNCALELIAPAGEGPVGDRLKTLVEAEGPGLKSLAFITDDIDAARRTYARRGLSPSEVSDGGGVDIDTGAKRTWRRVRLDDDAMAGVKTFALQPQTGATPDAQRQAGSAIALDHIVINTPNPDRALGIYGAKLGLRLALDQTFETFGARLMFFRVGGVTVEIAFRLGGGLDPNGPDRLWGLTWAVDDLAAAHFRLLEEKLDLSDIRTGRKPGTRVFTVRNGTLGVPTLFIEHGPR